VPRVKRPKTLSRKTQVIDNQVGNPKVIPKELRQTKTRSFLDLFIAFKIRVGGSTFALVRALTYYLLGK